MTHAQLREAMRLWARLEDARNLVAEARSSIYLHSGRVDHVTLMIVDLQKDVLDTIKSGKLPAPPKLGPL